MPIDPKEVLCLSKLCEWRNLAASGEVCEGPCFLLDVSTKVGAAAGVAIVYDGLNANADIFMHTGGGANQTQQKSYVCPPYLKNGIYVALDANITSVTVHFIREAMLK